MGNRRWVILAAVVIAAGLLPASSAPHTIAARPYDLNGDGFEDLVVGVPSERVGTLVSAGAVSVLYAGPNGITATGDDFITQDSPNIPGTAENGDEFGAAVASGDWNGDGFADLAIASPGEARGDDLATGSVTLIRGSAYGLKMSTARTITQATPGIATAAEEFDFFGAALANGNFDGDGYDDLAIGAPSESIGGDDAGAVHVLYGSPSGPSPSGSDFWTQDAPGVKDAIEGGGLPDARPDDFGASLSAGDFNADGRADLVVGVPHEDVGVHADAGAVHVLFGSRSGLTADGDELWSQNTTGIKDGAESARGEDGQPLGDRFGRTLATGDFDEDGHDDLAIGVPNESVITDGEPAPQDGAVHVLYGAPNGITASNDQFWHQNVDGVEDEAERDDRFGRALAAGDVDGDGDAELVVGVRDGSGGAAHLFFGSVEGVRAAGDRLIVQGAAGVPDADEPHDDFGRALRVGRFGRSAASDLAIGAPGEDTGGTIQQGRVTVLYGAVGGPTGDGAQSWDQDSPGVKDAGEEEDSFGAIL